MGHPQLGDEILRGGNGGGFPWCREHLVTGYTPQWYQHFDHTDDTGIVADAAILTSESNSRWYNYYVEGLRWMVENMDIDGIYLDDVSYDRRILNVCAAPWKREAGMHHRPPLQIPDSPKARLISMPISSLI